MGRLEQTAWSRSKSEFGRVFHTLRFGLVLITLATAAPVVAIYFFTPDGATPAREVSTGAIAIAMGIVGGLCAALIACCVRTPFLQRNEARHCVADLEAEKQERLDRSEKQLRLIVHMQNARPILAECRFKALPNQVDMKAWADRVTSDLLNNFGLEFYSRFSTRSAGLTDTIITDKAQLCGIMSGLTNLLDQWIEELRH